MSLFLKIAELSANYSYELNEELDKELKFLNLYKKIDKKW